MRVPISPVRRAILALIDVAETRNLEVSRVELVALRVAIGAVSTSLDARAQRESARRLAKEWLNIVRVDRE